PDVSTIREKKRQIITRYNDADATWHAQRTILTLRLRMEHGNDQAMSDAWKEMSSAVTDFSDCSRIWFEQYSDPVDSDKLNEACATRKRSIEDSINSLTTEILRSRQESS